MTNLFKDFFKNTSTNYHFVSAKACLKVAKNIEQIMKQNDINNKALAELLGCSKSYVTKILRGDANLTIETLAKLSIALDSEFNVELKPKRKEFSVCKEWTDIWDRFSLELLEQQREHGWEALIKSNSTTEIKAASSEPHKQSATIYIFADYCQNANDACCSAA